MFATPPSLGRAGQRGRRLACLAGALAAGLLPGCGRNEPQPPDATSPTVVQVEDSDPEMARAIREARDSLGRFLGALKAPRDGQESFLIKGVFPTRTGEEHIWIAEVTHDGRIFRGIVVNDPEDIPGLAFKDPVEVPTELVSDWMYVENGRLIGGFTLRVLRARMTDQERREQDARVPYRMD